jgi:hypothetical protein
MSITLPTAYTAPVWALWSAGQPIRDTEWLREVQNSHRLYADLGGRVPLIVEPFETTSGSYTQINSASGGLDLDTINPVIRFTRPYNATGTVTYALQVWAYGISSRVQVTLTAVDTNTTLATAATGTLSTAWGSATITLTPAQVGTGGVAGAEPRPIAIGVEAISGGGSASVLQAFAVPLQITAAQLPTE